MSDQHQIPNDHQQQMLKVMKFKQSCALFCFELYGQMTSDLEDMIQDGEYSMAEGYIEHTKEAFNKMDAESLYQELMNF